MARKADTHAGVLLVLLIAAAGLHAAGRAPAQPASPPSNGTLAQLIGAVRAKAKVLEGNAGMRLGFRSFLTASKIRQESVSYPDYVLVRVLYEATRDAGFWNLHWKITDREPNSDNIWRQWAAARTPSSLTPTASAECDELSALYAFLAGRAGVKGVGLFWPFPNHTVAVWVVRPADGPPVRVVVPTSQISRRSSASRTTCDPPLETRSFLLSRRSQSRERAAARERVGESEGRSPSDQRRKITPGASFHSGSRARLTARISSIPASP